MQKLIFIIVLSLFTILGYCQTQKEFTITIDGKTYKAMITEEGDTMILADIDEMTIISKAYFATEEEYNKYLKMKKYAAVVFPYAKEAIRIFKETDYVTQHLTKKEKKKRLKELDEELKKEFEKPLSNLTKLQGKILIKMIEKELNTPMYDLIKGVKGGFTAFYWHNFSKLYSYDLKEGYIVGAYPILDVVLTDFDLSYRIENESSLKYYNIEEIKNKGKKKS